MHETHQKGFTPTPERAVDLKKQKAKTARLVSGFTLVELLVVIGIFGILSASFFGIFSSVRRSGRDARRVADLLQVEQALRLYYAKCGMYPGSFNTATENCEGGDVSSPSLNPLTWSDLETTLKTAGVGVGSIPNDPLPSKTYEYFVQLGSAGQTPRAQCYILKATLEEDNKVLASDIDNATIENSLLPSTCTDVGCKHLAPVATPITCDETAGIGEFNYCVGNLECFHGN